MIRRTMLTAVGAAVCLWTTVATTQQDGGYHRLWVAPGLELTHPNVDWYDVDQLAVGEGAHAASLAPAWAKFNETLGGGWRVNFDAAFGAPHWVIGSFDSGISPLTEARATALTERFIRDLAEPLGVTDPRELRQWFGETTRNYHGHDIFGVDYIQTYKGYDVRTLEKPLRVRARWDLTLGKMSVIGSEFVGGLNVDVSNPIDRDSAIRFAQQYIPQYAPGTGKVTDFETFILVGIDGDQQRFAHLAHGVKIETDDPHSWVVYLDATTGDRLYVADHVCHVDVTGSVMIGILPQQGGTPPTVPFKVEVARDLLVNSPVGNAYTDANGLFTITNSGTTTVQISGRLLGRWCTVNNVGGGNMTFSQGAVPGTPANVVMNGTHTGERTTAETTAYFWTTYTRHMIANEWTSWTGLAGIRADVNENNSCNAVYSGGTINFFTSGNGCNNTAISDVIAHEYGHAFHVNFFGRINNGQFSEGIGDHLGLYARTDYDQAVFRLLGQGFRTSGGGIRDYRVGGSANNTQWPSQGKQVHKGGEIWGGAMIDMADNLVTKHGFATGFGIAQNISLAMFSRRPSDMPPGITETMVQDDNDANLANGTPNFAQIAAAADRHSIPRPPDPKIVVFTHKALTTTTDTVNGYPVVATITSTAGTISTATLTYKIDTKPSVTVPLAKLGNVFFAAIPAQPAVSSVKYSLSATDSKNNSARLPATGTIDFSVGREIIALSDDFETNKGWGPDPGDNASRGRFQRTDPFRALNQSLLCQPEDDTTPNGTMCWVTENGARNQAAAVHDVDNGKTSVVSPKLDFTGVPAGAAKLSFNYWLTIYTQLNDFMRVDKSTDDGKTWGTIWSQTTSSATWRSASVGIPGNYTDKMRLRFWVQDNPNNSLTDCLLDDILVNVLDDNVAALRANTKAPAVGATLSYTLRAAKEPSQTYAYAVSFNAGSPNIPGIGRLSIGIPFYVVWFATLDGSGNANFKIPIPNQPVLSGLDVYTQAVVAGSSNIISNLWQIKIQ